VTDPRNVSQLLSDPHDSNIVNLNPSIRSPLEHDAFSDLSPAPLSPAQLYHRTDVASSSRARTLISNASRLLHLPLCGVGEARAADPTEIRTSSTVRSASAWDHNVGSRRRRLSLRGENDGPHNIGQPTFRRCSQPLDRSRTALQQDRLCCEIRYLSLDFAEFVSVKDYTILDDIVVGMFPRKWIFPKALRCTEITEAVYFHLDILKPVLGQAHFIAGLVKLRDQAVGSIDHHLAELEWAATDIISFTTTFQQNVALHALVRRVNQAYPGICIISAGASREGKMGLALHRLFPFIDAVCSGEGDLAFPTFARLQMDKIFRRRRFGTNQRRSSSNLRAAADGAKGIFAHFAGSTEVACDTGRRHRSDSWWKSMTFRAPIKCASSSQSTTSST
jgi:hypothetical protein